MLHRIEPSRQEYFFHITYNNTIYGTKYNKTPDTGDIPLAADMSSCILSEEIDVSKFGIIYAGAQKNMGPAGLAVVIIRKDMVEKAGGKMQTLYTLGKCDFVSIIELPKEDDIMGILLCLGSMGNVRTTTMKAWNESEVAKMLTTPHP